MTSTETALREWRSGSTQAERLAAGLLRLEKFANIEPQAPIGGGDGGADILCDRGRYRWVCAVYFPPTVQTFTGVETKFLGDLEKAQTHSRNGFVFITNQRLTRGERQSLVDAAARVNHEADIYDVERMRGILDSPEGYGLRVSYLRISMTTEEQVAFFATRENRLADQMSEHTQHMRAVLQHLQQIRAGQAYAVETMRLVAGAHNLPAELPRISDPLAVGEVTTDGGSAILTGALTPDLLRLVHRLVCFDLPARMVGHFRTEQVVIRKASDAPESPSITPPAPADIPNLIERLRSAWRTEIAAATSRDAQLTAISRFFHGLTSVHPFLDGNGRVARSILMQQCIESFGHVDMSRLDRGVDYYSALQAADRQDLEPLKLLIERAVAD
jgi:fido (protein-threonine AMPylation protein)